MKRWGAALDDLERRYGVQRGILVAIWGRGSHFGRVPTDACRGNLPGSGLLTSRHRDLITFMRSIAMSDAANWSGGNGGLCSHTEIRILEFFDDRPSRSLP
ncbi:MAG TPA: lytic murein transglycosylase [Microvirga sp.]|nr:lytic murein transglycosylase [Microvirga sp.]